MKTTEITSLLQARLKEYDGDAVKAWDSVFGEGSFKVMAGKIYDSLRANATNKPLIAGQVVKGNVAGHFVIVSLRTLGGVQGAQLKEVNPENHEEMGRGELWLPLDAITAI